MRTHIYVILLSYLGLAACKAEQQANPGVQSPDSTQAPSSAAPSGAEADVNLAISAADFDADVHGDPRDASLDNQAPFFSKADTVKLQSALAIASRVTADTLFAQILNRLGDRKDIRWESDNLEEIPEAHHANPTKFMLDEYSSRGHYALSDLRPGAFDDPDVTASTAACAATTRISVKRLDRTTRAVAGTMVHERAHSFCHKHFSNDVSNEKNRCDFAYMARDLAMAIDQFRVNGSQPISVPSGPCKKLRDELVASGLAKRPS